MPLVTALYDPGQDITVHATVALVGGRCVGLPLGRNPGGPAGIDDTGDGLIRVGLPALNGPVMGVAEFDAPINGRTNCLVASKVVPTECSGAVPVGAELSADADGRVKPRAAGQTPVGRNFGPATTAAGQYVQMFIYPPTSLNLT